MHANCQESIFTVEVFVVDDHTGSHGGIIHLVTVFIRAGNGGGATSTPESTNTQTHVDTFLYSYHT